MAESLEDSDSDMYVEFTEVGNRKKKKYLTDSDEECLEKLPAKKQAVKTNFDKLKVIFKAIPPSKPLNQISSIAISKDLQKQVPEGIKSVKTIAGGRLLIEVTNLGQVKTLKNMDKLGGSQIIIDSVETNFENNYISGVIYKVSQDITDAELIEHLKAYKVTKVHRFTKFRDGKKNLTTSVKLTFAVNKLPESVKLGYQNHSVSTYVPPPLRCFHCQRYNHVAESCKSNMRCPRCGGQHKVSECSLKEHSNFTCPNCKGNHSAAYAGCPLSKQQANINQVMVAEKIPRIEAKEKVMKTFSYAGIVKGISEPNTEQEHIKITGQEKNQTPCVENTSKSLNYQKTVENDKRCTQNVHPIAEQQNIRKRTEITSHILEKIILLVVACDFRARVHPLDGKQQYLNIIEKIFGDIVDIGILSEKVSETLETFDE